MTPGRSFDNLTSSGQKMRLSKQHFERHFHHTNDPCGLQFKSSALIVIWKITQIFLFCDIWFWETTYLLVSVFLLNCCLKKIPVMTVYNSHSYKSKYKLKLESYHSQFSLIVRYDCRAFVRLTTGGETLIR